ncbi:MAG: EAL domain-containing protein [Desulfobacterales bacterium]|nr:EAL domain-containing protein [Desulfobacterales bacterium]
MGSHSDNKDLSGEQAAVHPNYQGLVEAANSIILSMDIRGTITYINPFGVAFFGFAEDELVGRSPVGTIMADEDFDGAGTVDLNDILEDPRTYANHTNENIKKDGTKVWVSWSNKGIYNDTGDLVEVLCVGNDITRIKQMEAELSGHRRNLESLVSERTLALGNSRNRLRVLSTISNCIIQDKTTAYTINQVLAQLLGIFESCGAAYIKVAPGATLLTIDYAKAPENIPDFSGLTLDVANARPFFRELIFNFRPYAFSDTKKTEDKKGLDRFIEDTGIRSGLAVPLQNDGHLMGVILIYSPAPRTWTGHETELMEQIAESLAVAIGQRKNKNQLVAQEQFLENVFDGVDIAIFALRVRENNLVLFENVNQQYEVLRDIAQGRVTGRALDVLSGSMTGRALELFKERVAQCTHEKKIIKFLEETEDAEGKKYWLTRLSPIEDPDGRVVRIIGASTDISEQKQAETALKENEARLREAQRIAKLGDCERDIHTRGLSCSDQLYNIFGWPEDICPGYPDFIEILHPDDRYHVESTIDKAIETKSSYDLEYRIIRKDGREKIVNEIGEVVLDELGNARKIAGIVQDVSEQKKFKDEIELARKVFDNAVEGVVVTGRDGTIQFVNKGFTTITGYTEAEAIGQNPNLLKSDRHDREFYREMWAALDREGHWSGEIWNRRKSGEAYPEWLSITAITNPQGEPIRYMSVFNDLSDIREREEQLKFQANYDALTGLPNRTLLRDRIDMSVRRVAREDHGLALIFLDMDDFKHVNDTLGHAKGDLLLQQLASRLLESVREQDTVARYGGDEFIVLIPDTNETDVIINIIERIRTCLQDSFVIDNKEFFLGVSIGVTTCPDDGTDPDTLIANADMAMYRSKEVGKGRYAFFTSELNKQVSRRVELEVDLRLALSRQEFSLYFQPKVDISANRICGAEALIRWNHPEKGVVSPMEFIPLAEETGLINPMGEWILDEACAMAKAWSKVLNRYFSIAVNISSRQVKDVDLVEQVRAVLGRHQIPAECLELEITESSVMGNVEKAKNTLRALHDMGIRISLDDFGTGFSSLSYLRIFPISNLKIDKSFIDDIPGDTDSNTMVSTIISMAGHLNLTTVAEGVEEHSQFEFLKTNGCNQIQGYFFAPPMPAEQFLAFLKKHE